MIQITDVRDEETGKYVDVPRIARTIPFGYKAKDNDKDVLEPVLEELAALELARDYVKRFSLREVANWITTQTGRKISHVGLQKRLKHERIRKNKAEAYKKWARFAEIALKKAEELEKERIGAKI
ncbi:MAG: hypothetical protein CMQ40_06935 [Gammaproteobacteria bacterium]|nr:hypothetical protein [Gammaproteobacteria bacterium]